MVKAIEPNVLKEYGNHLELTTDWARHLSCEGSGVRRKDTTGIVEPSE